MFNYDPVINPMPAYKSEKLIEVESSLNHLTDEELEDFTLPEGIEPLLSEQPLYT